MSQGRALRQPQNLSLMTALAPLQLYTVGLYLVLSVDCALDNQNSLHSIINTIPVAIFLLLTSTLHSYFSNLSWCFQLNPVLHCSCRCLLVPSSFPAHICSLPETPLAASPGPLIRRCPGDLGSGPVLAGLKNGRCPGDYRPAKMLAELLWACR